MKTWRGIQKCILLISGFMKVSRLVNQTTHTLTLILANQDVKEVTLKLGGKNGRRVFSCAFTGHK